MDYIQSDEYEPDAVVLITLYQISCFHLHSSIKKDFALSLSRFANSNSVWCAKRVYVRLVRYNMAMCHGWRWYSFILRYICVSSKSNWMEKARPPASTRTTTVVENEQQLCLVKYTQQYERHIEKKKINKQNDAFRGWKNCTYLYLAHPGD